MCQSWKLAAYDPALWRNAKPRIKNFNLSEDTAKSLKTRNIRTVKLDVIESEDSSLTMLFSNLSKYAQIENLTFIGLVTDSSITQHLPDLFTSLRHMEVNHSAISFKTREGLVGLFSPLVNLEQLCISQYYDRNRKEEEEEVIIEKNPRFDYFEVVFSCLPKLKSLEVAILGSWNSLICLDKTADNPVPNLLQLTLVDTDSNDCGKVIEQVSRKFPNLKHLYLSISDHCGDDLQEVEVDFKHLESLTMDQGSCMLMIPDTLRSMCHGCSTLKALDVSVYSLYYGYELETEDVAVILKDCVGNLRFINIKGHGTTLKAWTESLVTNLKFFEVLVLGVFHNRGEEKPGTEIKAEFLNKVGSYMPNLISLLGVRITRAEYDSLPALKYITKKSGLWSCSWSCDITTRSDRHQTASRTSDSTRSKWIDVAQHTPEWFEATGWKYFQLELPDFAAN